MSSLAMNCPVNFVNVVVNLFVDVADDVALDEGQLVRLLGRVVVTSL